MENELYYQYDKRYFVKLDAQIRWYYERSIKHDRFSKFHKLNLIKLSSFKIIIIIEITNHKRGIKKYKNKVNCNYNNCLFRRNNECIKKNNLCYDR